MNKLTPKLILLLCLSILLFSGTNLLAQSNNSSILFIYDASGSMWGKLENETKKEAAANVLSNTVNDLESGQKVGIMAYGHRTKGDCNDVEFLVGLENTSKSNVISAIKNIIPLGKTPLAYSAELAIEKIKENGSKTTIILVTDGIESCNGNLCEVIRLAREAGIEFKMHIVGFGLKEDETEVLKCAAKEGGGNYYNANDADQLSKVLNDAVNQKIDDPEPNHSFYTTKNGKPVDAWIKIIDKNSGAELKSTRTYQDTAHIYLPLGEFSLSIRPLEGTDIAGKKLDISKTKNGPSHHTISFDGGELEVLVTNNKEGWDATIKVIDRSTQKTIATNRTYGRVQDIEINSGFYDVKIFPLNMKGSTLSYTFENVEVMANKTTPLTYNYDTGTFLIGVETSSGELIDAVVKIFNEEKTLTASGRTYTRPTNNPKSFILQKGKYTIEITTLGKHKGSNDSDNVSINTDKTTTKNFIIK